MPNIEPLTMNNTTENKNVATIFYNIHIYIAIVTYYIIRQLLYDTPTTAV